MNLSNELWSHLLNGQFSFEYPYLLGTILLFWVCAKWCQARGRALYFPHVEQLVAPSVNKQGVLTWLKWIGIVSAIMALASPVVTQSYTQNKKDGRDIVLILDASESMKRQGFDRSHLSKTIFEVAKEVLQDFIEKRTQDRIGLVTFADIAFIASPLTFEKEFLKQISSMQAIGYAGKRTAINDAVLQSFTMLSKSKTKSKVAILLTDGIDNMSKVSFTELKDILQRKEMKLYTIGIGRANRDYDANYLQQLAKAGGGRAYGAMSAQALNAIYEEIGQLEKSKINDKRIVKVEYLFTYPLFLAILSLILYLYIKHTRGLS
jgi:Ca-activated chloride channel family protein